MHEVFTRILQQRDNRGLHGIRPCYAQKCSWSALLINKSLVKGISISCGQVVIECVEYSQKGQDATRPRRRWCGACVCMTLALLTIPHHPSPRQASADVRRPTLDAQTLHPHPWLPRAAPVATPLDLEHPIS
jgi:hypothetical protein